MNNVKEIEKINLEEARLGINGSASWHNQYRDSPYIFIGGLDSDLNEGDIIAVFSQWGEPLHCHLVRDQETGEPRGFAFLAYLDQRSTILAVDNMNGSKLLGRVVRVDHCDKYKPPKEMTEVCEEEVPAPPLELGQGGEVDTGDGGHSHRRRRHGESGSRFKHRLGGEDGDGEGRKRRRKHHHHHRSGEQGK